MFYQLTIKCVHGRYLEEPYEFTVQVPEDMNLTELHMLILDTVKFDHNHLFDFFIARRPVGEKTHIVEAQYNDPSYEIELAFNKILLNEIFPLPKGRALFYLFDFGDYWIFRISRRSKPKKEESFVKYPRLIKEVGPKPIQYRSRDEDDDEDEDEDT
jgi:hypothetical protein